MLNHLTVVFLYYALFYTFASVSILAYLTKLKLQEKEREREREREERDRERRKGER